MVFQHADELVLLAECDDVGDVAERVRRPAASAQYHANCVGPESLDVGEGGGLVANHVCSWLTPRMTNDWPFASDDGTAADVQPDGGGGRLHVQRDGRDDGQHGRAERDEFALYDLATVVAIVDPRNVRPGLSRRDLGMRFPIL
jgi:hypothetical protein